MRFHLSKKPGNRKVGSIKSGYNTTAVSTQSRDTCPDECPIKGKCYAEDNWLGEHWNKVDSGERGTDFETFIEQIKSLKPTTFFRYGQGGDLPGIGSTIDAGMLRKLTEACKHLYKAFAYTHKPLTDSNLAAIKEANDNGFVMNLSANNLEHADRLSKTGLPIVTLLPKGTPRLLRTPEGNKVVQCPAQTRGVTCADCKLCAMPRRNFIIGFEAHGPRKNATSSVAKGN